MPRIRIRKGISVAKEDLQKSLGPNCTPAFVKQWKFWLLYPELFLTSDNNDHRRAVARVYIQKIFANDKWKNSTRKGGAVLPPDNELAPSRIVTSPTSETSEAIYGQDKVYAKKAAKPPSSLKPVLRNRPRPTNPTALERTPATSVAPSPPQRRARPSDANMPVFDEETAQVAQFLETCTPPMTQFLPSFLGFGCKNEDFLQGVNLLPDDAVESFLNSLPACGESKFTMMDILVLKNHFRAYLK
ncbi:uncharacterized protein LACBIDRAFT_326759 [Laccaria bicolor S238N-H82]|uniref:Predicted protein n=1 Tax=Laccaria bicolor (strain S238N-H82 / ATCC MYA-4686) TaxID=486041 RepID=B0D9L1_LACBS|nr:uncharacterized protein LACBIDRAFT_326759 [Laccaria bicolor S238N-H82]EDR08370.1 predicted protein [Laccaria bicolor S238N-H82]|eukprot:XP_001880595.1 predicted protein [Laccaria bicolor S238N-H82]